MFTMIKSNIVEEDFLQLLSNNMIWWFVRIFFISYDPTVALQLAWMVNTLADHMKCLWLLRGGLKNNFVDYSAKKFS